MDDGKKTQPTDRSGRRRINVRAWLRALHRDTGYLIVGLTVIYALSGLAVNHIDDWDANYTSYERTHQLGATPKGSDQAIADAVLAELGIEEVPQELYRSDESELEILFDKRALTVNLTSGSVHDRGRDARPLLRIANWLHLNRGKKAWTYIADGYAVLLLGLALSGSFMLKGAKGFWRRGALLITAGAAVPVLYVVLSGGP